MKGMCRVLCALVICGSLGFSATAFAEDYGYNRDQVRANERVIDNLQQQNAQQEQARQEVQQIVNTLDTLNSGQATTPPTNSDPPQSH